MTTYCATVATIKVLMNSHQAKEYNFISSFLSAREYKTKFDSPETLAWSSSYRLQEFDIFLVSGNTQLEVVARNGEDKSR